MYPCLYTLNFKNETDSFLLLKTKDLKTEDNGFAYLFTDKEKPNLFIKDNLNEL